MWRRLSRTHTVLGREIPEGWVPMSEMKVRSLVVLSIHSALHRWSAQSAALLLLSSYELMSCCAAGTNGCLDLRCHAFPLDGQVSAAVPSPRVALVGLAPKQISKPTQIEIWNTINQYSFIKLLECQAPLNKCKAPIEDFLATVLERWVEQMSRIHGTAC